MDACLSPKHFYVFYVGSSKHITSIAVMLPPEIPTEGAHSLPVTRRGTCKTTLDPRPFLTQPEGSGVETRMRPCAPNEELVKGRLKETYHDE